MNRSLSIVVDTVYVYPICLCNLQITGNKWTQNLRADVDLLFVRLIFVQSLHNGLSVMYLLPKMSLKSLV